MVILQCHGSRPGSVVVRFGHAYILIGYWTLHTLVGIYSVEGGAFRRGLHIFRLFVDSKHGKWEVIWAILSVVTRCWHDIESVITYYRATYPPREPGCVEPWPTRASDGPGRWVVSGIFPASHTRCMYSKNIDNLVNPSSSRAIALEERRLLHQFINSSIIQHVQSI